MDDILVFPKNREDPKKHVGWILQKLREHKLSLKPEKCWFSKKEIEFLGLIISEDSITMDKGKVEAIRNCYNHGTDSLHYAILISRTGLVIFFLPT